MNNEELSKPLGKKRQAMPSVPQLSVPKWAPYGALGIVLGSILLWPLLVSDPNGGQPVAVVDVELPRVDPKAQKQRVDTAEEDEQKKKPTQVMSGTTVIKRIEQPANPDAMPQGEEIENQGVVVRDPIEGNIVVGDLPGAILKMKAAPDPRLVEKSSLGLLPIIGNDGSKSYRVYARPVTQMRVTGKTVRVAIMVGGMGLSATSTQNAIVRLPTEVTMAFAPYGTNLQAQVNKARADGHEVMLQIPLEPFDYPSSDSGPHTLLTSLSIEQNQERLRWFMSRFTGYIGVVNYMGGKFTAQEPQFKPVLQEIRDRGLMYMDDGSSPRSRALNLAGEMKVPFSKADVVIDLAPTPEAIDARLADLESIAYKQGTAIGSATGLPVTIERIAEWSRTLEKRGITLVPISAAIAGAALQ